MQILVTEIKPDIEILLKQKQRQMCQQWLILLKIIGWYMNENWCVFLDSLSVDLKFKN
jgi:hypothetical protein